MTFVDDAVHRGDVPPPIDLAGHMRELGRAALPALIIAVLIGAGVFYVRSELTDKQYAASVVAEIKPTQTLIPGDAFIEQLRAPFIELSQDRRVLDQVLAQVDSDLDAAQLASSVELTAGTSPALLTVTATTSSPELSGEVAEAMVVAMASTSASNASRDSQQRLDEGRSAIDAQQARVDALSPEDSNRTAALTELGELRTRQSQLQDAAAGDQLVVLSNPEQSASPVSPKPISEALVAALAALVVAAELIVLLRGRLSRKPSRQWARRLSRRYGARFDPAAADSVPPVVTARIVALERGGRTSTRSARHSVSKDDSTIVVLVGASAVFERPPTNDPDARLRRATAEFDISDRWWEHTEIGEVETVVMIVSKRGRDKKAATTALRRVADFGIPVHLVLQSTPENRPAELARPATIMEGRRDAS